MHASIQVFTEQRLCPPLLPSAQPSGGESDILTSAISLKKMGSENQSEVVHRQRRKFVATSDVRKNVFRHLRQNQIILDDGEPKGAYRTKAQILCDFFKSFAWNMIVDVVERTSCRAARLGNNIAHLHPKPSNQKPEPTPVSPPHLST